MHLRSVPVHSKRSLQSTFKHRMPFAHGSFFACTELLFGNASLDSCSRAAFCSISSKRRMVVAQPPSVRDQSEVSSIVQPRRHAKTAPTGEASSSQPRRHGKTLPAREVSGTVQVRRQARIPPEKVPSERSTSKSTERVVTCNLSQIDCVRFYSEWWISCFKNTGQYFSTLEFPLANIEIWVLAYRKVYLEVTGNRAVDETVLSKVAPKLLNLTNAVLTDKYKWADPTRLYLTSPELGTVEERRSTSKGSPSPYFQDTVVQEALLLILEPIFEARFSSMSHACRPGRDAHTAIKSIRRSFPGCVWFIKGDCSISNKDLVLIRVVDSINKVVMDFRIIRLLRTGLLTQPHTAKKKKTEEGYIEGVKKHVEEGNEEVMKKGQVLSRILVCGRLMPFLCNVYLDQLDCWMDERIRSLSNRNMSSRRSSSLLFKPAAVSLDRRCRLAYVRYGTQFLVASNSPQTEVEEIKSDLHIFLNEKLRVISLDCQLTVSHISTGVTFLDHIISQRVEHPVLLRRTASNGIVMEKKALGIVLSIKASRECCMRHLQKIGCPSSSMEISELLIVLNNWYCYAENRKQAIQICKFILCSSYANQYYREHNHLSKVLSLTKFYKEAMKRMDERIVVSDLDKVYPIHKERTWLPKHEKCLRNLAWMQNSGVLGQKTGKLLNLEYISPQQNMSQLVWQFLRGCYPIKSDYCIEPEIQLQTHPWGERFMVGSKSEDLAHSAG